MTWNARSLINRNKQEYLWIKIFNLKPDVVVITETCLNYKLFPRNQNYVWAQSLHEGSKGIAIITRKELWWKEENIREFEGCLKLVSIGENNSKVFIFGVYLNKNNRQEILKEIKTKIRKIKRWYRNEQIIITGDFNARPSEMYKLEKLLKVSWWNKNFNLKTRRQICKNKMKESTLDYILATKQIENLKKVQVNEASDHQILIGDIETEMVRKRKLYKISKTKMILNKEDLEKLVNSEWPLEIDKELGKRTKIEQLLRPMLYTKKNICYKINNSQDWEEIWKLITDSNKEEYIKDSLN